MEAFKQIPIDMLRKSPSNPRRRRDQKKFEDLCASVKEKGIIQPIVVRETGDLWEIVVGEGRYLAAEKAGLENLPAMVRQLNDLEVLELQIIENAQREDVHPLDEGEGYKKLMSMDSYDVGTIAAKVGKSESWVYQRMKLADLIEPAKEAFVQDAITAGHAILLARLQPKDQEEALKRCFQDRYLEAFGGKRITQKIAFSVRELESWIQENVHLDLHSAPWKKDDLTLYPSAGSCTNCQKRTGFMPALFPDIAKKDTCTDPACFKTKQTRFIERKKIELTASPDAGAAGERGGVNVPVLISTGYYKPEEKGVLKAGTYTQIKSKADRCKYWTKAVIAEGPSEIGQVREVCASLECKQHTIHQHQHSTSRGDAAWAAKQKKQREKEAAQKDLRLRILDATLAKVPKVLSSEDLRDIAVYCYGIGYDDGKDLVNARHGWGNAQGWMSDLDGRKRIASLKPAALPSFLMELVLCDWVGWHGDTKKDPLLAIAKRYKINVKTIESGWAKEQSDKAAAGKKAAAEAKKKSPAKKTPVQSSAKPDGKQSKVAGAIHPDSEGAKIAHALHTGEGRDQVHVHPDGAAHLVYDEPTCIHCGCTEAKACVVDIGGAKLGCSWIDLEEETNRGLCSACTAKGLKFKSSGKEDAAMTSKKAKPKKANKEKKKAGAGAKKASRTSSQTV